MRFEDILAPSISLRVRVKSSGGKLKPGDVRAVRTSCVRGEFELLCMDESVTVVPCEAPDVNRLASVLSTGRATLARLSDVDASGGALLTLLLFRGGQLEMGDVEIGVDERVKESFRASTLDEAAKVLFSQSVLKHGGKCYFVIVAGGATREYLEGEESERSFAIIGSRVRYALTERDKGNGETVFLASNITKMRNRNEDSALRLVCGNLKFVDWMTAGQRSILAKAQFEATMQGEGSYFKKWDEFAKVEGDLFFERARAVDKIAFKVLEDNRDGTVRVQCLGLTDTQKTALENVRELEVVDDDGIPEFLGNLQMTFADYSHHVIEKDKAVEILGVKKENPKPAVEGGALPLKVDAYNRATGELILIAQDMPVGNWLVYPVAGEVAQIRRRANARNAIADGRAANPDLGLLIQEEGRLTPSQPPPKMRALTTFVERKVFPKNPPTQTQRKAIEIALNTPDIALIQGPPGTGKTTVIAAIIERLNEECDKRNGIRGRVLLSGFQHDAVENMIGRLKVNGLPVPKFGKRSGEKKNADVFRLERELREWCDERMLALRRRNPQIAESTEERKIRELCVQYITAPSLSLAISLLDSVLRLPENVLGAVLGKELQVERNRLVAERDAACSENPKLAVVRGMRVTEAGFCDDGPDRAADALYQLKDDLDESERDLLRQASRWTSGKGTPPFIGELHRLKGELLSRYAPIPVFRTEKARDSVVKLIKEVISRIRTSGLSARDKRTAALAEFLQELENNPTGAIDAVSDYSFAFAATCQQSVNKLMQQMKGVNPDMPGSKLEYDFVIIDEAARVSPRDLMIPMSQGKRIILVGDHRQLPQLLDEEVAKRMEADATSCSDENDWLTKSMFEYLFTERIPKLEAADRAAGKVIPRLVTLDRQYRMHPDLGDFISRNFYERFGEKKIESGLKAEMFAYDLPETDGKCAVWLDVPLDKGEMQQEGTSWTRPAEIDAICDKLKAWVAYDSQRVACEGGKPLSFGVIAFYKAQTDMVAESLGEKWIESVGEDRLRIGTVDSFQGREFDVVFLSLVRTGNKGFGFLKVYNRLNVSMSRQKKLLVAVGDAAFYDTDAARQQVPGLADFLKLCREKGREL